jgi:hypothetical protein
MAGVNIKVGEETFGGASKSWLRTRMGLQDMKSIMLDISSFSSNHLKNGYIPSGTALGVITDSGKYGPYAPDGDDGREVLAGHLFEDARLDTGSVSTATDVASALYWHGVVNEANLPSFDGTDEGMIDDDGKADVSSWIQYW